MPSNKTRYSISIKLRNNLTRLGLVLIVLWSQLPTNVRAQDAPTYDMQFVTANVIDTVGGKDVAVFFRFSAANAKDFPPVLSMRVAYFFDNSDIMTAIIGQTKKVSIAIFGKRIEETNKLAYNLVKDKVDLNDKSDFILLAFVFRDLTRKPISEMTVKYGLWEKRNTKVRLEKEYEFHVEN